MARATKKYRPYPDDELCPCDSSRTYGDCCKSKTFKFELDATGNVVRSVPIPPEGMEILKQQKVEFKKHFGRNPGKGDLVFFQQYERPYEDMRDNFKEAALAVGVEPAKVYASWKTGLMPVSGKLDRMADVDLDEWQAAASEYDELVGKGLDPFDQGPQFTANEQQKVSELIHAISKAPLILASVLERGVPGTLDSKSFFQMYFASQALHFLRRFNSSMSADEFDGGLYLCRSVYEAALRVRFLNFNPEGAEIFLAIAGVGENGAYEYQKRHGKTVWSVVRNKKTGELTKIDISNRAMVSASGKQLDLDVYSILFRYLSRFVHPDVQSLHRFFSMEGGFSIFVDDNPFDGVVICGFVLVLLFSDLSQLAFLRDIQRRDARFYTNKLSRILLSMDTRSLQVFAGSFACMKEKVRDAQQESNAFVRAPSKRRQRSGSKSGSQKKS